MVEADARRKKIQFPEPLKLKLADAKNLTMELVGDADTPKKVEPKKAPAKPEAKSVIVKETSQLKESRIGPISKEAPKGAEIDKDADPATDPIAACFNERIQKAKGVSNNLSEADAKRLKVQVPASLKLKLSDAKAPLTIELVKDAAEESKSDKKNTSFKPEAKLAPKKDIRPATAKAETKKAVPAKANE